MCVMVVSRDEVVLGVYIKPCMGMFAHQIQDTLSSIPLGMMTSYFLIYYRISLLSAASVHTVYCVGWGLPSWMEILTLLLRVSAAMM